MGPCLFWFLVDLRRDIIDMDTFKELCERRRGQCVG